MTRVERGILDTSALLSLGTLTEADLPEECLITAITLAELSVAPHTASTGAGRSARQAHLQQAEADFDPIPFDTSCARAFGQVAAALREQGRKPATRSSDALIAATALAHQLAIYTCNAKDFEGIPGLTVHDVAPVRQPPHPRAPTDEPPADQ